MKPEIWALTIFLGLFSTPCAVASEVAVTINFSDFESLSDELVSGVMTVEVENFTDSSISNVYLRGDNSREISMSADVLQFGILDGGGVGVVSTPIHTSNELIDTSSPTLWRLDYDKTNGEHRQIIVTVDNY